MRDAIAAMREAFVALHDGRVVLPQRTRLPIDRNKGVSLIMPGSINTAFNNREPGPDRAWALQPEDCAAAVVHVLSYPENALVSRVEMRPSRPPKR